MEQQKEKQLTLQQAMSSIQTDLKLFTDKGAYNSINKFNYFTETDLYNVLKPKMKEYGLSFTIEAVGEPKFETIGKMTTYHCQGVLSIYNETEKLELGITLAAQNTDPAKAIGSALTYGTRYWLCKNFAIPTEELDPDNEENTKAVADNKKEMEEKANVIKNIIAKSKVDDGFKKQLKELREQLGFEKLSDLDLKTLKEIIKSNEQKTRQYQSEVMIIS